MRTNSHAARSPNFSLGVRSFAGHNGLARTTSAFTVPHLSSNVFCSSKTFKSRNYYGGCKPMISKISDFSICLRDVNLADLDTILAINNSAGESILPIDRARMARFLDIARYFRVAEINGQIAGFLIALTPDADYDSPNFIWFKAHYPEFVYIDRVVMTQDHRRSGIGRLFYADILSFAEVRQPILVTEVFIQPRDEVSLLFFKTQGFVEAGQQSLPNGRRVSLMCKSLDPYTFVRDSYLSRAEAVLPAWAWQDRLNMRPELKLSA